MIRCLNAVVVGLLVGPIVAAPGCARKYVAKVAPFERGTSETVLKPAPRSGMYHVQFVSNDRFIKDAGATPARWVQKGEPVGFRQDASGNVIGIVGDKEVPVIGLPAQATHVMWYHKWKQPTQFGKSLAKTGEFMQQMMLAVGVGAGAIALGGLGVYALLHDDDNDCNQRPPGNNHKPKRYRH